MTPPIPGPPRSAHSSTDPVDIGRAVEQLIAQVDELRRSHDEVVDLSDVESVDLSRLDAQANLLERAHGVLSVTLAQLDRV